MRMTLTTRVLLLFIPILPFLVSCQKVESDSSLAKHEAAYPEIRKKYVYQSLIRLANINRDPEFEKLIKDVRKVILYLPPKNDSTYQIKELRTGMRQEGYEELIDVRTADAGRISLWVKETNAHSHYLALLDTDSDDLILEIDGQIHLEHLSAIQLADKESLLNLLKSGF
jgi:hypothetical protein